MHNRERVFAALDLEEPDRIPLFELIINPPVAGKIIGHPCLSGLDAKPIHIIQCCRKLKMDMIGIGYGYGANTPRDWKPIIMNGDTYINEWGGKYRINTVNGTTFFLEGTVKTEEDFEKFEIPDPHVEGRTDALELAFKELKKKMVIAGELWDVWEMGWNMRGLRNFMIDFYTNPSFAEKLVQMATDWNIELGKALIDAGAEVLITGDDYGESHGLFLSPKIMRRYLFPYYRKLVRAFKKRSAFVVKHCCGNIHPIIKDFIEAGTDGLHPIQPVMNIGDIKEEFGERLCLMGNIDCGHLLTLGSRGEIDKAVKDCINAASPGGGHVLSSSNSIHSEVPVTNFLIMLNCGRKYGRYSMKFS